MLRWTLFASFCVACEPPPEAAPRAPAALPGASAGQGPAVAVPGAPTSGPAARPSGAAARATTGGALRCEATPFWAEVFGRDLPDARVLEGTIDWPEEVQAAILIDLVDPDSLRPVYGVECLGSGAFRLEVPGALSSVVPLVFLDRAGDGPTPDDPQGRGERVLLDGPVTGLTVALQTDAPLQGLRPDAPLLPEGARLPPPAPGAP